MSSARNPCSRSRHFTTTAPPPASVMCVDQGAIHVKCLVDNVLASRILLVELAYDVKRDITVSLTVEVSGIL